MAPDTLSASGRPISSGSSPSTRWAISACGPVVCASVATSKRRRARGSPLLCSGCPYPGMARFAWRYSPTTCRAADSRDEVLAARASISARKRPAASEDPSTTEPQPRIPAATAPCSASGAAASVMRAACTLGTRPCSAIATRVASRTRRCAGGRQCTGQQQPEVLGEADGADQLARQVTTPYENRFGVRG